MMPRKEYRLYRWQFSPFGMAFPTRGRLLGRFPTFADMAESADRRARLAGYYDIHDWMYLFDWEREEVNGSVTPRPRGVLVLKRKKKRATGGI